jgi:hypothetical protein
VQFGNSAATLQTNIMAASESSQTLDSRRPYLAPGGVLTAVPSRNVTALLYIRGPRAACFWLSSEIWHCADWQTGHPEHSQPECSYVLVVCYLDVGTFVFAKSRNRQSLYCTVLCCCIVLLYCTAVLYCFIVLYRCIVLLYCTVVLYCCVVMYCCIVLLCCNVLCCTVLLCCSVLLYSTVMLYCTVVMYWCIVLL